MRSINMHHAVVNRVGLKFVPVSTDAGPVEVPEQMLESLLNAGDVEKREDGSYACKPGHTITLARVPLKDALSPEDALEALAALGLDDESMQDVQDRETIFRLGRDAEAYLHTKVGNDRALDGLHAVLRTCIEQFPGAEDDQERSYLASALVCAAFARLMRSPALPNLETHDAMMAAYKEVIASLTPEEREDAKRVHEVVEAELKKRGL